MYRGLWFCCILSYTPSLAISISLKNRFNSKSNSEIEYKPNLEKFLKKFNSLSRHVTVRASNALMQRQKWK